MRREAQQDRTSPAPVSGNTCADTSEPGDGPLSLRKALGAVHSGSLTGLTSQEEGQVPAAQGAPGSNGTAEIKAEG
jgi:hypothetical protein